MTFWICSSLAVCSITMTIEPSVSFPSIAGSALPFRALARHTLQPPRLVDDPLEHPAHGHGIERPGIVPHHALQDPGLALRRVHGQAQPALDAADLHRA